MAFFKICVCCNCAVCATIRFCRSVANSDSARVTSSGAIVPISSCFLLSPYSFSATVTACCCTFTFSRAKTNSQYAVIVFVIVVIACCENARSAILRLFFAMRMLRVFTFVPNPFSSCCERPTKIDDCTDGLNKFAGDVDELRVLSHAVKNVVPV